MAKSLSAGSRTAKDPTAVVVLPAGVGARAIQPADRRWLARGTMQKTTAAGEALERLLAVLGRPAVNDGTAALRRWGQTGERPEAWVCGADPVYLEARLDHLCLFALQDLGEEELASLIGTLQARLGLDGEYAFSSVGACGYLERAQAMATATVPAVEAHARSPDPFLPVGRGAAGHDRLQSELQMCLHELPLNREREAAGRLPVNSLWFWGGGRAPAQLAEQGPLPVLFADDPLATGYWLAAGGRRAAWPGSFAACAAAANGAFVAVVPRSADVPGDATGLGELRRLLAGGDLEGLTLVSGDGVRVDLTRSDRLRFWRRETRWPGESGSP